MEKVIRALREYDKALWKRMKADKSNLADSRKQQQERPAAGVPSRQLYGRSSSQIAWQKSLCEFR